jgi:methyl-accepting chemotaxis protein
LTIIAILFLNGCQFFEKNNDAKITQSVYYLAEQQAERISSRINSDIQVLKTLAIIMGNFESLPMEQRRNNFDYLLESVIINDRNMVQIYTVWKPNSIDGMDSRYIGRIGSSPTGQYAIAYSRETGYTTNKSYENIRNSMEYIHGPYASSVRVDNPIAYTVNGKDTYVVNVMVPIINPRTGEIVGNVGSLLDVHKIQNYIENAVKTREEISREISITQSVFRDTGRLLDSFWGISSIKTYDEIAALVIYASDGTIIGSVFPERIGRMLSDADITLYGNNIRSSYDAVIEGKIYQFRSFVPFLEKEVEIVMYPFTIGNWDIHWTVMIASPVDWWKKQ